MAADYGGCEDGDEDDDWGENVCGWCDVDYVDYVDNVAMFWFNIYSNWFNSFVFFDLIGFYWRNDENSEMMASDVWLFQLVD